MGASVAGQIRIDIIGGTAGFTPAMREGRQEIGSFREEYDKLTKAFESRKNVAARAKAEQSGWETSMRRLGGGDAGLVGFFDPLNPGMTSSQQRTSQNRQDRLKSIPWDMSYRTELTREAAETAAKIGATGKHLSHAYKDAIVEITSGAANASGMGGMFGSALGFAKTPMGAATIGASAIIGTLIHGARERDRLTREIEDASEQLGQGSVDTSKMIGAGFEPMALSKFQKAISDQSPEVLEAFRKMRLSPDELSMKPLLSSLTEVGEAFESRLTNPADRASVAMHLFGKGGASMIHTLQEMKVNMEIMGANEIIKPDDIARVKAWDHAWKGAVNTLRDAGYGLGKLFGSESGISTHMARGLELLSPLFRGDMKGLDQKLFRFDREDYNVRNAEQIEAEATKHSALQEKIADDAKKYADAIAQAKQNTDGIMRSLEDQSLGYERGANYAEASKYEDELKKQGLSPDKIKGEMDLFKERQEYRDGAKKEQEKQAEREREAKRQTDQEFEDAIKADTDEFNKWRSMKKSLRSPEAIARDDLRELNDARNGLGLKDDEYRLGRSNIAKKLMESMGGAEIRAVGMLEAGSAAAHTAITQANTPDPKIGLMQQAIKLLESLANKEVSVLN